MESAHLFLALIFKTKMNKKKHHPLYISLNTLYILHLVPTFGLCETHFCYSVKYLSIPYHLHLLNSKWTRFIFQLRATIGWCCYFFGIHITVNRHQCFRISKSVCYCRIPFGFKRSQTRRKQTEKRHQHVDWKKKITEIVLAFVCVASNCIKMEIIERAHQTRDHTWRY